MSRQMRIPVSLNKSMRVLFIAPYNPYPPTCGGQERSLDEIYLYARYAQVDMVTFYDQAESDVPALLSKHLDSLCRKVAALPIPLRFERHRRQQLIQFAKSMVSSTPFRIQKFWNPKMAALIQQWLEETPYDIIHFDHLSVTRYYPLIKDYPAKRVCTESNVEWEVFDRYATNLKNPLLRLVAAREAKRVKRYEVDILNRMHRVIALSDRDKDVLQAGGVRTPVYVFRRPLEMPDKPITTFEQAEPVVISLGRLDPTREHGTLWFAQECWHRVRQAVPNARWHIIGSDPSASVRALHHQNGISVEGFVEDLTPFLRKARMLIVPLFIGGGIRNKILDMQRIGIPCVSTTVGIQGLENEGVWVADDPQGFSEGVIQLLTEPEAWTRMAQIGRDYIHAHYAPESVGADFERFLKELVAC
jgi:glycosyltransferase involved in cell wall biosynthesis